jgi:hypothetical protein
MSLSNNIPEQPNQVEQANPQQTSLPTPSQHSNGTPTEWQTWRKQIPTEAEKSPPEVQRPSIFKSPPGRGRGTGRGRARSRSRRASKARSSESSTSEPDPTPVPYRGIQDAQEKPIFRDVEHDREGLGGMIGVTKEEWDLGLRTPVYAPPSDWMRLRQLQMESEMARKRFWVEEIDGYGTRRAEEVELGRRVHEDIMKVGWVTFNKRWRREELMGVPTPDEPVLRKKRVKGAELTCAVGTGFGTDGRDGEGENGREDPTATMPTEFAFGNADEAASRREMEATAGSTGLVSPDSMEPGQVEPDTANPQPMEGVEGEGRNGKASSTPPDLGEEDAMRVKKEEVSEVIVWPAELTSATKVGATVGRPGCTAEPPISTSSSFVGGDESDGRESGGIRFDPEKYRHFSLIPGLIRPRTQRYRR